MMSPIIQKLQCESYELTLAARYHIEMNMQKEVDLENEWEQVLEETVHRKALTCITVYVATFVNVHLNEDKVLNDQESRERDILKRNVKNALNTIENIDIGVYRRAYKLGERVLRLSEQMASSGLQ